MTAVSSPALNIYYTRDSAQVAQEKYSNATWNNAYAYITLVAFAALALVANVYLFALLHPATLLLVDAGIAALGYTQVLPQFEEWINRAEKLNAQGEKETRILAKERELRAMDTLALREQFVARSINIRHLPDHGLRERPEVALLARVIWHDTLAEVAKKETHQLFAENKFEEVWASMIFAPQARIKAAFFASLIKNPHQPGKFKDSFAWMDMSAKERGTAFIIDPPRAFLIMQTREPSPRFFSLLELGRPGMTLVAIGDALTALRNAPQTTV